MTLKYGWINPIISVGLYGIYFAYVNKNSTANQDALIKWQSKLASPQWCF